MKRLIYILSIIFIGLNFNGCVYKMAYDSMNSEYDKVYYIDKLKESELALIKTTEPLIIVTVDNKRKVNFAKVTIGIGIKAMKIKEGIHTIMGYKGVDINIGKVFYKKGHEYLIDYKIGDTSYGRTKIHYWVKDITTNEIVYGKEIK